MIHEINQNDYILSQNTSQKNNLNFIGAAHLSEKNNDPNLVKRDLSFAVDKDESFIKIIDQDDGLNWITV